MNLIEEIKSRINIVAVARDFGLQPTHNNFIYSIYKEEKNRSLKLYEKTNSFYCYSAGRGGDVINFYADYKKIENSEAIKLLRDELGLQNNGFNDIKDKEVKSLIDDKRKTEIYHSFEKFCDGLDEKTFQYLKGPKRGLSDEIIKKFRLFSVNDLKKTIDYLLGEFPLDELKACGLFNDKGRFVFSNHKLIVPYLKENEIIYLRGRNIPINGKDIDNKYIGLSGQPAKRLFNKNTLMNLSDGSDVLICEGEFDAMKAEQMGYKSIGIPGVNNFPQNGKAVLKNYELFICFDNDDPGRKGSLQVAKLISKQTTGIYFKRHNDITEYFNQTNKLDLNENEFIEWEKVLSEKTSSLKLISAFELQNLDIPPINWIINDLIPEGLTILAGRPKIGKSWLAMNLAIAVANGNKAIGHFDTNKTRVLYIALEDNYRRIQERMNNILNSELDKNAPNGLYFLRTNYDLPKLNEGGIEEIQKLIDDDPDIKFIIIDTLGRSIADKSRKDRDSYRADYDIGSKIQGLAIKNNIALFLLHHTKKAQEENVFDEISGTTGLTGAMDTMMVLRKKNNEFKLHITGRDIKENEYSMVFDENIFCWNVVQDEIKTTAERKEIYDILKDFSREMKTKEIANAVGKELSNVSKLLGKMVKDGLIITPKYGSYKLPDTKKDEKLQNKLKSYNLFESGQSGKSAAI